MKEGLICTEKLLACHQPVRDAILEAEVYGRLIEAPKIIGAGIQSSETMGNPEIELAGLHPLNGMTIHNPC